MQSLHHLWMKTYLRLNRMVLTQTAKLGLSPGQPKVLEYLFLHGENEQKAIAMHCEIEPATVGNILSRMEAAGLVVRRQKPGNRRSLYVSLTEKGEALAVHLTEIFAAAEAQMTASLTEQEKQQPYQLKKKKKKTETKDGDVWETKQSERM